MEDDRTSNITSPSDDEEIRQLQAEIRDLLDDMPESVLYSTNRSREIQALKRDNDYQHYVGESLNYTDNDCFYLIRKKDQRLRFKKSKDFFIINGRENKKQSFHVISDWKPDGTYLAKMIVTEDIFDRISKIEELNRDKYSLACDINKLPTAKRKLLFPEIYREDPELENETGRFRSLEELRLFYIFNKNIFTMQQRLEIEAVFDEASSSTGGMATAAQRSRRKLQYVLNIQNKSYKKTEKKEIKKHLDRNVYAQEDAKTAIIETLSSLQSDQNINVLFVGDQDISLSIINAIADCYSLYNSQHNFSSISNLCELIGTDSSYDASDAGVLAKDLYRASSCANLIYTFTNIDAENEIKEGKNALLSLLTQLVRTRIIEDSFITIPISVRSMIFATASSTQDLPDQLLKHFSVINIKSYTKKEVIDHAKYVSLPKLKDKYNIETSLFTSKLLNHIFCNYCETGSITELETNLNQIFRHIHSSNQEGNRFSLTHKTIQTILGNSFKNELRKYFLQHTYNEESHAEIEKLFRAVSKKKDVEKEKYQRLLEAKVKIQAKKKNTFKFDPVTFKEKLHESHYGKNLDSVVETISMALYEKALIGNRQQGRPAAFLLVGDPGTGKTSLSMAIANVCSAYYEKISLNSINAQGHLKGYPITVQGATYGKFVNILKKAADQNKENSLVLLDELDKCTRTPAVDISNTLLDVLDGKLTDMFYGTLDTTNIIFIGSCNDISKVDPILLDRFETVIYIPSYTQIDKANMTRPLLSKLSKIYPCNFEITNEAIDLLTTSYTTSTGVRDLESALKILARKKVFNKSNDYLITAQDVENTLGPKPLLRGNIPKINKPGLARGLAVTENHSGMCFGIETAIYEKNSSCSSDSVIVTGLAQETVQESVKLCLSILHSFYPDLINNNKTIHIHYAEASVKKEGPSAGLSTFLSIASATVEVPLPKDYAFTGEIDILGNVYPVGGVPSKIEGASRAGCSTVYVPYDNYTDDLGQLGAKLNIKIIPTKSIDDVVNDVLPILNRYKRSRSSITKTAFA